jgi:hypothetical protein
LYLHDKPKEPNKEGPLSYILFESPFISLSAVSRGYPSLVSLVITFAPPTSTSSFDTYTMPKNDILGFLNCEYLKAFNSFKICVPLKAPNTQWVPRPGWLNVN